MPYLRIAGAALANTAVYGALLFVPAGTLDWPRAWLLLSMVFFAMVATRVLVLPDAGGLLAERRKSPWQPGQPVADKLLVVAFLIVFPGFLAFIPLDAFRFHLLAPPGDVASMLGLVVFVLGLGVIARTFRENAFAVGIVKDQRERGQSVVDSGPYALVRHPLYGGIIIALIGGALWLQSTAGACASIVPIIVLVARIIVEESFLRERLPGYRAYAERVRSRLVPRVW